MASAHCPPQIHGENLTQGNILTIPTKSKERKALVVIFLSAKCPCSNSHINELKSVAEKYPEFNFVGIHSNVDEDIALAKKYFPAQNLPFPVVQDEGAKMADSFKAYKTPHAYVISPEGEILFQGGVTESSNAEKAKEHFLADALEDLRQNRKIKITEARTLGCTIQREKNSW